MRKFCLLYLLLLCFAIGRAERAHTKIAGVSRVDGKFQGITADLYVEIAPGTGRVFVDTMPLTMVDTQASARLAKEVACELLEIDCFIYNFFYTIRSEYTMVGGPSAGGAMAVATLAVLTNKSLYQDVILTGTINPDGSIGPVGGILEKAEACYKANATLFLIPRGQSLVTVEGERVDIKDYAASKWGLEVLEVSYIQEVFAEMTGYEIVEKPVGNVTIATQEQKRVMKLMAGSLLKEAELLLNSAREKLESSRITEKASIEKIISEEEKNLEKANGYYEEEKYYSAASQGVRVAIFALYAEKLVEFYSAKDGEAYISSQIEFIREEVEDAVALIFGEKLLDSIYDLEVLSIAMDRIREAKSLVAKANQSLAQGKLEDSLYEISFAEIRRKTALSWHSLVKEFEGNESIEFSLEKLESLAQRRLEEARNSFTYASVLTGDGFIQRAEERLGSAEQAYLDQEYIYSIFESLKTRAESNLAIIARGLGREDLKLRLGEMERDAVIAISRSEERGLLPILAISYLEYGRVWEEEDPVQAAIFLAYSKEFAKVTKDIVLAMDARELPRVEVELRRITAPPLFGIEASFLIAIVFLIGVGVGFWLRGPKSS
jgi:uncharacterized protein